MKGNNMVVVDYASVPPTPEIRRRSTGTHMANYDRIYANSLKDSTDQLKEAVDDPKAALQKYLAMYENENVDYVLIKAKDCRTTFGVTIRNEDVAEFCHANGPRYVGMAGVDPNRGMDAVRELEYAVKELGMIGLNIQCFECKVNATDPIMYPLYAKCIELDVPVNLHMGMSFSSMAPMSHGKPIDLDKVMVDMPELKVIAGDPGFPWVHEMIGVAWRHRNVYIGLNAIKPKLFTTPNSGYEALLQYGARMLQDQMICGSNWPLMPVDSYFEAVRKLPLSEEIRGKWTGGNAAEVLKLG